MALMSDEKARGNEKSPTLISFSRLLSSPGGRMNYFDIAKRAQARLRENRAGNAVDVGNAGSPPVPATVDLAGSSAEPSSLNTK
jgi:hypothetical protein